MCLFIRILKGWGACSLTQTGQNLGNLYLMGLEALCRRVAFATFLAGEGFVLCVAELMLL